MDPKEKSLLDNLKKDPANPIFAEYAEYLRRKKRWWDAIEVCMEGLSHNPSVLAGRIVLARIYYQKGWLPFAVRELELIYSERPDSAETVSLLKKLSPDFQENSYKNTDKRDGTVSKEDTVIAETEFDLGDLEV